MPKLSGFRLSRMFHPTALVVDLNEIGDFYEAVFGTRSRSHPYEHQQHVYRSFKLIGDAWIEHFAPEQTLFSPYRLISNMVGGHWVFPCFYTEDMQDLIHRFHHRHRIRMNTIDGSPVSGLPPYPGNGTFTRTFLFTHPWDTGISWEFWEGEPEFMLSPLGDPRVHPDWKIEPADAPRNLLGVRYVSHHTVVVDDPKKTVSFLVDLCGAKVLAEDRNDITGTASTWLSVADDISIFEIAQPLRAGPARSDLDRVGNAYHSLNLLVADLDKAVAHLERQDVELEIRSDSYVLMSPKSCAGLRFGLTSRLHRADPRST